MATLSVCLLELAGCSSLMTPISGVPSHRLPEQFHALPKNDLVPVDISRLRKPPAREYLVDADDILGIYIESVLGSADEAPPVHMPEAGSDLPPSIGFPIPVRENGTLPLPLVPPIQVRGLTLQQIENIVRRAYTIDQQILPPGKDRIIVTLMRKRTYHVIVMRQDGGVGDGETELSTRGQSVELESGKNDVLNALAETGGLPGLNAKNEVLILKASRMDPRRRDEFTREFYATPIDDSCLCRPPLPEDPAIIRIPLRLSPGAIPRINPQDITLGDGDIVYIESREREVFYTGGLLGGGEHPLPRDYDLDVLSALAMVGSGVGSSGGSGGGGRGGGLGGGLGGGRGGGASGIGGVPPGQLYILRQTPCDGQITIAVDLTRAINSPAARPLVMPGDILVLQYKPEEEVLNFGLGTFFTYGIFQLLQNNGR
jgi:protein involved in polysaccharide export with SLBB domain